MSDFREGAGLKQAWISPVSEATESLSRHQMPDKRAIPTWLGDVPAVMFVLGAVLTVHLIVPGSIPSGPDGGNWLAMARETLGDRVMAGDATYPPGFPVLLAGLLALLGPIGAISTAALLSTAVLVIAVYVCGRPMGRLFALICAVVVGTSGAQLEAYSWGAYPQTLASGLALMSVYALIRHMQTQRRAFWVSGAFLAAATLATHLLVGGLLLAAIPIAMAYGLWATKAGRAQWWRQGLVAAAIAVPGFAYLYQSVVVASNNGYTAPINPLQHSLTFAVSQQVREAPALWIVLLLLGLLGTFANLRSSQELPTRAVGVAWALVGVAFFLGTGEGRSLLLTQAGVVLLAGLGFRTIWRSLRHRSVGADSRRRSASLPWKGATVLGVALVFGLVVGGIGSYPGSTGWFRVVDHEELLALDRLASIAEPDDLAVASPGNQGHPLGWWVQGYAGIPTYSGIDLRWLAFPEEREQARIANELFRGELDVEDAAEMLASVGADFLVIDRRDPTGTWFESGLSSAFPVIYDSGAIVIARAEPFAHMQN
jgi:hypothetical protein